MIGGSHATGFQRSAPISLRSVGQEPEASSERPEVPRGVPQDLLRGPGSDIARQMVEEAGPMLTSLGLGGSAGWWIASATSHGAAHVPAWSDLSVGGLVLAAVGVRNVLWRVCCNPASADRSSRSNSTIQRPRNVLQSDGSRVGTSSKRPGW
jgi:hypothetical protein